MKQFYEIEGEEVRSPDFGRGGGTSFKPIGSLDEIEMGDLGEGN